MSCEKVCKCHPDANEHDERIEKEGQNFFICFVLGPYVSTCVECNSCDDWYHCN